MLFQTKEQQSEGTKYTHQYQNKNRKNYNYKHWQILDVPTLESTNNSQRRKDQDKPMDRSFEVFNIDRTKNREVT